MLYFEKNKNAQKIRENVVADQKSAYVIYEWSPRREKEKSWCSD